MSLSLGIWGTAVQGSGHEESEIFPPPLRKGGVMRGEMGTTTKGCNTHLIVVGSEEADLADDEDVSITDEMGLKMEATPLATDAITRVKEGVSMHTGLDVTGTNDTTQEENKVFVWKDVGGKLHRDNPRILDASMQPDTNQKQRHRFDIHRH